MTFKSRSDAVTRVGLPVLVLVLSILASTLASVETTGAVVDPPNVVFVMADDMRPDEMDRVADLKPNGGFDWVRDRGVSFRKLWSTDNLCCPGRTTLLTGQTAYNHKVFSNTTFKDLQSNTLPIWLQNANYCTGFTGKYLNKYSATQPRPAGWTYWEPFTGNVTDEYRYKMMQRDGSTWQPGDFITDRLARVTRAQLNDCLNSAKPAFVALWPVAPHFGSDPKNTYANVSVPWSNTDPSFNEADLTDKPAWLQSWYPAPRVDAAAFYSDLNSTRVRTLLSVDDALKSVINLLALRGELSNTVIVLTSDNGFLLGEHRIASRKRLAYEAAQTNLWIAGPGFPRGVTSDAFAMNLDVAPTILKATGVDASFTYLPPWDGRKLQSVLAEPDLGHDRFLPIYVPVEGPGDPQPIGEAVRTWRYKYVKYADSSTELYDLFLDPYEEANATNDPAYSSIKTAMISLLQTAKTCRSGSCRASAPLVLQQ